MLDTSVAILLRDSDPAIVGRIADLPAVPLISILSRVELEGGLYRDPDLTPFLRPRLELLLQQVTQLPFEEPEALAYGAILARLGFSRTRIIDRMIAAQALTAGATLATLNPRDFRGIPGLTIDDWSD